jgi:hypothetical protein
MASPSAASFRFRLGLLVALAVAALVAVAFLPPIPQDPSYHAFADQRSLLGLPNFWNVVSNAPFFLVGGWGLAVLFGPVPPVFLDQRERWPFLVSFAGALLVGAGSSYYHWNPTDATLFWDRLPMTLVFMGLFSAVIMERIHARIGALLLLPFLGLGIWSVEVWRLKDDLRFYALVQFYPMLAIPLMALLFPAKYTHGRMLGWLAFWYGLAKLLEHYDAQVYEALQRIISGHSLKHVAAAMALAAVADLLRRRRPVETTT